MRELDNELSHYDVKEKKRLKNGIPIEDNIINEINKIIDQQGLEEKLKL